ncbi:MAG: hypothetical protein WD598_02090 [Acidimicrobiia bacterium]
MVFALVATDEGITMLDADGTARPELDDAAVARLVRTADGCWAIADRTCLLRRLEDGSWDEIAQADANLTCLLPFQGGVLAGTTDGQLLRVDSDSVMPLAGFDSIDGREDWHAVPSGVPYVRSLTATADAGAVLANVHVGGIPRSTDAGATWSPTIDPDADVHEVRAHPTDPALVLAAAAVGFAKSTDGGVAWHVITDGLHATYARAVAFTNEAALVTVSDGPFSTTGAVYRWILGGDEPLEQCLDGLPGWLAGNVDTGCLDAAGEDAVLVDAGGAVFASGDDGMSWFHLADVEGANSVVLA